MAGGGGGGCDSLTMDFSVKQVCIPVGCVLAAR